eukprot:6188876-Pleurochrysis_carterae.AAC.1
MVSQEGCRRLLECQTRTPLNELFKGIVGCGGEGPSTNRLKPATCTPDAGEKRSTKNDKKWEAQGN